MKQNYTRQGEYNTVCISTYKSVFIGI